MALLPNLSILSIAFLFLANLALVQTWQKAVFYIVLSLASIGFSIVLALQIKAFFTKEETKREKTWESLWTVVPLIILIALWWFF